MKAIYLMLMLSTFTMGCGSIRNYNHNSKPKILAEKTTLSIPNSEEKAVAMAGVVAALAPSIVDLSTKIISHKLKTDAAKYIGTYKASVSAEKFYKTDGTAELPTLLLERKVIFKDKPDSFNKAVSIKLTPELSGDSTAFRYKLDNSSFGYLYSIAKLVGKYDYIDLHLEMKVKNLTVNSNKYELNDISTVTMVIPAIKVGDTTQFKNDIYSGWIPLFPQSLKETGEIEAEVKITEISTEKTDVKKVTTTTSEKITTKNTRKATTVAAGVYEIEVTVSEVNMARLRAQQRAELFDATSESGGTFLKAIVDLLTKKSDEEK